MNNSRVTTAFMLCTIIVCVPPAYVLRRLGIDDSDLLLLVGACAAPIVLVAVPLFLRMRRRREIGVVDCLITGALIAAISMSVLLLDINSHPQDAFYIGEPIAVPRGVTMNDIYGFSLFALFGACLGGLFWLIGLWRPPNTGTSRRRV
jgi:hypothetical protein